MYIITYNCECVCMYDAVGNTFSSEDLLPARSLAAVCESNLSKMDLSASVERSFFNRYV